jgi:spermidine synthase
MPQRVLRWLLLTAFAASGAAALVYQVVWVRLFTLALGHTVAASSTVLAAFMGGLAAGAWIAGGLRTDPRRSLFIYATLELLIAALAISLPATFSAVEPLIGLAYADGSTPIRFAIVRVVVSLVLLGIPAAAMGATYPIAVSWMSRTDDPDSRSAGLRGASDAGLLYTFNTAGAAAGAIAAGFWLIPAFGLRGTTWVAVALNVAAACAAVSIARVQPYPSVTPRPSGRGRRQAPPRQANIPVARALAITAAALSGFAALVYEVTWTRLVALIIGPTTYAFALMAVSFISGIALGSSLGVRIARGRSDTALWLASMLVVTAVTTLLAAWFTTSQMPLLIAEQVASTTGFGQLLMREALALMVVLMPPSISLGATFALALATASSGAETAARDTARVYTANTIGAVAGALAAGFLLIPLFGLQATVVYTSRLLTVAGVALAIAAARTAKRRQSRPTAIPILIGGAIALATFALPEWDRDLLTSGAYKYSRGLDHDNLEARLHAGSLEYYSEGAAGTVSVRRLAGTRALAIDGKVDASDAGDMLTQRLLGLLPTLLHPAPREALVIGLGSGVTVDAVIASGEVQRTDVVEISPEVVEASAFFEHKNGGVLTRPGVRLLVGDGRSHLRLSPRNYDVIVSEPSNPWMAGVAALFTREFFEAARARLRTGGVFCQWAHTYEITQRDLQSIVRTFSSVFPHGTMWLVGDGDLLLIGLPDRGINSRLAALPERLRKGRIPALLADIRVAADAAPFMLLSMFAGGPGELASYGAGSALQIDDRMSLEFTAVPAMYAPSEGNAVRLRALRAAAVQPPAVAASMQKATAADWTARGLAGLRADAFGMAHESFRRAIDLDARSGAALRGSADAAAGAGTSIDEAKWLRELAADQTENAEVRIALSYVLASLGSEDEAITLAVDAARIEPARPEPLEQLASILSDIGDGPRLQAVADELVRRFPARVEGRYYQAAASYLASRTGEADTIVRALLAANPAHAKAHNLSGVICANAGNHDCAKAAFEQSMRLDPRDPSVYVNLGSVHLERGEASAAADYFAEALAIDMTSASARDALLKARAMTR